MTPSTRGSAAVRGDATEFDLAITRGKSGGKKPFNAWAHEVVGPGETAISD